MIERILSYAKNLLSNSGKTARKTALIPKAESAPLPAAFTAVVVGLAFTFCATFAASAYSNLTLGGIRDKIIRFHILANSDSEEDQALKLALRDAIFERYADELNSAENISETREFLNVHMEELRLFSEDFVKNAGYDYSVSAALELCYFPTRDYGELRFPAGEYEALRVVIGDGGGQNFWCVMFPPLCFIDVAHREIAPESSTKIKNILSEEEYSVVSSKTPQYTVKFKIIDIFQKWMGR